jgi:hypothetical protein
VTLRALQVKALKEWFGGRFGVEARNNVTMAVHHKCFMGLRHYMLSRSDTVADNLYAMAFAHVGSVAQAIPRLGVRWTDALWSTQYRDQRLTTDADQFCTTYGTILTQATVLPFLIGVQWRFALRSIVAADRVPNPRGNLIVQLCAES